MNTYATVVLVAGKGTAPVGGLPLLAHVIRAIEAIPSSTALVPLLATISSHRSFGAIGHETEQINDILMSVAPNIRFCFTK